MTYDRINDPIEPDIVFLGLILVSFFPPKVFPNIYPPISEKIHIINIVKKKYLSITKMLKQIINVINKYIIKVVTQTNLVILLKFILSMILIHSIQHKITVINKKLKNT